MQRERVSPEAAAYLDAEARFVDVGTSEIAYRTFGAGPPLLMIHGWPLDGFTFRKLLPRLAAERTAYVIDLPGARATRWRGDNDFSFRGQAANVARFLAALDLPQLDVVAHDTGATIARQLALTDGQRLGKLALIGTEIPGHRPPWIPLLQRSAALPGSNAMFRLLLRSRAFRRSSMGFGNVFRDRALLDGEFFEQFVAPLLASDARMEGQRRYLRGIDWSLVDSLAEGHARIEHPVLLVWGADDPTFPVERARPMVAQFPHCVGLREIPDAKLLVHEEKPDAVCDCVVPFLRA